MADDNTVMLIRLVLAIILPPLGVFHKQGLKADFWVCLILCFFGYLPGIIYAILVIAKPD